MFNILTKEYFPSKYSSCVQQSTTSEVMKVVTGICEIFDFFFRLKY